MLSPVRETTTRRHESRVLPVLVHIEDHLDEPLPLDELAALGGFSPHHFHRVFTTVVGEAPKEYLRRLRLERAVARLKVSPDNVLQLALEAGFATHETFTRAFAARFGVTPSEFRRMLRGMRDAVAGGMQSRTFEGFTDETPLTLRFDLEHEPGTVEKTPARHLIFTRHRGFERLADRDLWAEVIAYADARGIPYDPSVRVGIAHDDPYVTDDERMRFDAALVVPGPIEVEHPVGYREVPPALCVVRHHTGGMEEIAKTFSTIGVAWLAPADYRLRAAAVVEVHRLGPDGEHLGTDAFVPLEPFRTTRSTPAPRGET